ncbi:MAG: YkgJ family cysteine cluster protein [Candidatus Gastranaerophilales bacterium]|nr:YkgJ family cysteine cluster protein [Candidatus Gastranaerophilales bacterium]
MSLDAGDNLKQNEIDIDIPQAEEFPQYLCKTCGRCCKSITTSYSYEELKQMNDEGEPEAKVFIEFFKPYPSIEEARKVVPEQVEQVLNTLKERNVDIDKVTFFYCPYISDKNLCSKYETRPSCCSRAPRHGWSLMPPGCGFEGWQFEQREKHKKLIRSLKEYLYVVENLSQDGRVPGRDLTIDELRKNIEEKIKPWERFGSMFW